MINKERRKIPMSVDEAYLDNSMKIDEVIAALNKLKQDYSSPDIADIILDFYDDCDIIVYRYESDKEYNERIAYEEKLMRNKEEKKRKRQEAKKKKEYEQYLKLKRQFEVDNGEIIIG